MNNKYIHRLSTETVRWSLTGTDSPYGVPMTWLVFSIDYALWGLNLIGYHQINNIFHALNAGMYLVLSFCLARLRCLKYIFEREVYSIGSAARKRSAAHGVPVPFAKNILNLHMHRHANA